ncbi:MAG TPA: ParB/RepB/Spo0J family partition protein, partial [Acetobacteraceae bacterium]|nr:ParB/RepB/Spo0J family partition protein [Acetobacteraceae bacterium]
MSGKGNRGFADLIAGEGGRAPAASRLPPRTGILSGRENRLSELASGNVVTRVHELVDPARCRIWEAHNRDYAALDETSCADLIESMKAQGRQEVPAIVRRVRGEEGVDYEVICGARRHWTVSWLRAHAYPEFRFLIEPRELSDEEAFRVADLENRSRKDLSDHERAVDYARALERYYEGSQQRMAERLQVSRSWLSRYLELAKLPDWVVAAFGSAHVIGITHAAKLAPLLRAPATRRQMEGHAEVLAAEQNFRRSAGRALVGPAEVVSRLTERKQKGPEVRRAVVKGEDGRVLARGERERSGAIAVSIPANVRS